MLALYYLNIYLSMPKCNWLIHNTHTHTYTRRCVAAIYKIIICHKKQNILLKKMRYLMFDVWISCFFFENLFQCKPNWWKNEHWFDSIVPWRQINRSRWTVSPTFTNILYTLNMIIYSNDVLVGGNIVTKTIFRRTNIG